MYKNDVGKGGICDHEAYEAKKIKIFFLLCEPITPTPFLYTYILLRAFEVTLLFQFAHHDLLDVRIAFALCLARWHSYALGHHLMMHIFFSHKKT